MQTRPIFQLGTLGLLALLLTIPYELFAQQSASDVLRIRRLEGDLVRAPQYQVRGGQSAQRQRQWLQVRTEFQTAPEWIDEVTFTYYIVLRNRRPAEGEQEFNLFRGESSYINVARSRDGQSTVFLHPSTVERFGELFRVGVVVTSQGRVLAMESSPSADGRWWEQLTPRSGLVLTRRHTPFAMINFDDFEASPLPER